MPIKYSALKKVFHDVLFRPSSEKEMLAVLEKAQFRILADGHHFDEATQKAIAGLSEKLSPTTSHFMVEAPPELVKQLAGGKPLAPNSYLNDFPIDQSDVAGISTRIDAALRQGKPVHGVDVVATFNQLAHPKADGGSTFQWDTFITNRLRGDKHVSAEIKKIAGDQTATISYGEGHMGRPESIDAFLPRDKTAIVGVYPNQKSFEEAARSNVVFEGTSTAQNPHSEWLRFIKIADTGDVFANTAFKKPRAKPTSYRIIPTAPK